MNQQSEHLSDAQIEDYGDLASGAGTDIEAEVEKHLAECPSCRNRLLDFQRTRMGLLPGATPAPSDFAAPSIRSELNVSDLRADQNVNTDPTSDCPSESNIRDLAAGLLPEARAAELTQHSSTCDRCGALLRMYTEDFSDEFTKEEQAILATLGSASPAWQQQAAKEMVKFGGVGSAANVVTAASQARKSNGTSSTFAAPAARRSSFWKWALIPATAAVCALVAFGVWYRYVRDTPEKVEKLLAQAYTEQRTMEMRWPGAEYAVLQPQERGRVTTGAPSAYQAKAIILRRLEKKPDDPKWLQELGREEMLEWHSDEAIADLGRALQISPDSVSIAVDLAMAHYQRAAREQDANDYRQSIALLGKALSRQPDDPVILFNRALLYQRMSPPLYESALGDWTHYLEVDPQGNWNQEAQRHKREIEELKKNLP